MELLPLGLEKYKQLIKRALRRADAYINITGNHCHRFDKIKESTNYNIPLSRFLRVYSEKTSSLRRIKVFEN